MRYERFEQMVLVIGGATIIGGLALAIPSGMPDRVELIAQLLLFGVLFCAVRYGRRGGTIAAITASALYVVMRIPVISSGDLETTGLVMLMSRLVAFGLVGVVGGEIFTRMRYSMAKLEGQSALDDWSRVFNQRYLYKELDQARARYNRYGEAVSVVIVEVSAPVLADLKPARQRTVVRGVAEHIRADLRMVDEVGRLEDGRFVVLLPHTPKEGALVVTQRLGKGVRRALGSSDEAVRLTCYALPEDVASFSTLVDSLAPIAEEPEDGPAQSSAYSSGAPSTLKPAAMSASSDAGSSTLNTSTAAAPEGSTKQ